jgi:hypothetical protein
VVFKVAGKEYTIKYGIKALKHLEQELNATITEISDKFQSGKFGINDLYKIFAAGLITKHPDLTTEDIENIMDELGIKKVSEIIAQAFNEAFKPDEEVEKQLKNF